MTREERVKQAIAEAIIRDRGPILEDVSISKTKVPALQMGGGQNRPKLGR